MQKGLTEQTSAVAQMRWEDAGILSEMGRKSVPSVNMVDAKITVTPSSKHDSSKKDRNSFSTAPSLSSRYHFEGIIVITQDTLSTDETILEAILSRPVIAWSQDGESSMTTVNGRYDMPRRSFRRSCISTFHRSGEDWRCFFRFFHSKVNDLDFRDPFKFVL